MNRLIIGFLLGVSLSGTVWAIASNPVMPSAQGARPDQLWQQDILHEHYEWWPRTWLSLARSQTLVAIL
jgi:hypothetical protein